MKTKTQKKHPPIERPSIFGYHDYRTFLQDWFGYMKKERRDFTMRALARKVGLSCAYLPLVLAGSRNLSVKAMELITPELALDEEERLFLGLLRILANSESESARRDALVQIQRFRRYQLVNPREIAVYQYLEKWYYVAIREMTALPGFRAEPKWISQRLKGNVQTNEIKQALRFLSENEFIEIKSDGSAKLLTRDLSCVDSVFRIALKGFHRQMFQVAEGELGGNNPPEERFVMGHTATFPLERFDEVKAIIRDAIQRIEQVAKTAKETDTLYHTSFFAIPLAKKNLEAKK